MKYHGGKVRTGKLLAAEIIEVIDFFTARGMHFKAYIEPFCGMMGVYEHIINNTNKLKYQAGDTNMDLIAMWQALQTGWTPPNKLITENQFNKLKKQNSHSIKGNALRGYVGFAYSYRGVFFNTYFPLTSTRVKTLRTEIIEKGKLFSKVNFYNKSYEQWSNVTDCILYLDPPYSKQNIYYRKIGDRIKFDTDNFWEWVRKMSKNNLVLVSEYRAPKDFFSLINIGNEKLFVWDPCSK